MDYFAPKSPILITHYPTRQDSQRRCWQLNILFLRLQRRKLRLLLLASCFIVIVLLTLIHRLLINNGTVKDKENSKKEENHHVERQTMRTIIGRYVGPNPVWASEKDFADLAANLSAETLNSNNYDPDPEAGKDGKPVYLPGYNKNHIRMMYSINRFNLIASDKISVDRRLPDPRKLACRQTVYDLDTLPRTSIIIVFHNEAWSTLARTVHSILNTSPKKLLHEIILVDDASNRTFLGKSLEYYMNNLGSMRGVDIKILRSANRIGLVQARLLGVHEASGRILTFIDAHCEATNGWLEPLLAQVKLEPKSAACPIIDIINDDTFAYGRSFELHWGAFNWGLNFRWYQISRRELLHAQVNNTVNTHSNTTNSTKKIVGAEYVAPFRTPIMAGGLFSIDREFFTHLGLYDPHMDIWGGENIELSLRLWQCGGRVHIVPCSHVAHIFRKSSPYTFREGREVAEVLYTNLARVAEVWMDEWRSFFYALNPIVRRALKHQTLEQAMVGIDERKKLRNQLQCKNFQWFLDNVWPEHFFPSHDRFTGQIKSKHFEQDKFLCLQRPTKNIGVGQAAVGPITVDKCFVGKQRLYAPQLFVMHQGDGFIKTDENICLDSGSDPVPGRSVILAPCTESRRQKWNYDLVENLIIHNQSGLCLNVLPAQSSVQLEICKPVTTTKKWELNPVDWSKPTHL